MCAIIIALSAVCLRHAASFVTDKACAAGVTSNMQDISYMQLHCMPLCAQALPPWPSVLSVGTKPSRSDTGGSGTAGANGGEEGDPSRLGRLNPANALRAVRRRTPQCLLSEHCLALWTDHRPMCTPDRALMSRSVGMHSLEHRRHPAWLRNAC